MFRAVESTCVEAAEVRLPVEIFVVDDGAIGDVTLRTLQTRVTAAAWSFRYLNKAGAGRTAAFARRERGCARGGRCALPR